MAFSGPSTSCQFLNVLIVLSDLMRIAAAGTSLASLLVVVAQEADPGICTICQNASNVTLPNKVLDLTPLGEFACGDVDSHLSGLVPNASSPECAMIQSNGGLCGCEVYREDGCDFCRGSNLAYPYRRLRMNFFEDLPVEWSCEQLHSFYIATAKTDDISCNRAEWIFTDFCGCSGINVEWHPDCTICSEGEISLPARPISIDGLPYSTCGELDEAVRMVFIEDSYQCRDIQNLLGAYCGCPSSQAGSCTFCPDGGTIKYPNNTMSFMEGKIENAGIAGWTPTCGIMESYVSSFAADSGYCAGMQMVSSYCGCPKLEDSCEICPGEDPPAQFFRTEIQGLNELIPETEGLDVILNCEMAFIIQDQVPSDSDACSLAYARRDLCGCNNEEFDYSYADSDNKRALLAWLPRLTATLSITGSIMIIVDVLGSPGRRYNVYNQLVLFMSLFDVIFSFVAGLTTLPIPVHDEAGNEWKIYGAIGNRTSCKVQGFLLEWAGATSFFFNVALGAYYVFVFAFSWRQGPKRRKWYPFFIAPLVCGLTLGIVGWPHYDVAFFGCQIKPLRGETRLPMVLILVLPVALSLFLATVMTVVTYVSIRCHTHVPSPKGVVRSSANRERIRRIEKEVFWQCAFYLGAFYVSWPLVIFILFDGTDLLARRSRYYFHLTVYTIIPVQGFLNSIVYFRPRVWRMTAMNRRSVQGIRYNPNWLNVLQSSFRSSQAAIGDPGLKNISPNEASGLELPKIEFEPSAMIALEVLEDEYSDDGMIGEDSR